LRYDPELFIATSEQPNVTDSQPMQQHQQQLLPLKEAALYALERFTHIPSMDSETFSECLILAMMNAGYAPLAAVELATRCGCAQPALASKAVLFLTTELLEPVPAFENNRNSHIGYYRAILQGLRSIGAAYVQSMY
jgi:hypothetical protein